MGNANSTRNSRATLTRCTRSPMDSKLGEVKENVANPNDSITHQIDCHGPTAREQDEEDVTYAYVKVEVTILAKRLHILKDETILVRSVGVKESHILNYSEISDDPIESNDSTPYDVKVSTGEELSITEKGPFKPVVFLSSLKCRE